MPVDSESNVTRALIEIIQRRQAKGDQRRAVPGKFTRDGDDKVVPFPKPYEARAEALVFGYRVHESGVFGYRSEVVSP